jgi:hypothetical protein
MEIISLAKERQLERYGYFILFTVFAATFIIINCSSNIINNKLS